MNVYQVLDPVLDVAGAFWLVTGAVGPDKAAVGVVTDGMWRRFPTGWVPLFGVSVASGPLEGPVALVGLGVFVGFGVLVGVAVTGWFDALLLASMVGFPTSCQFVEPSGMRA